MSCASGAARWGGSGVVVALAADAADALLVLFAAASNPPPDTSSRQGRQTGAGPSARPADVVAARGPVDDEEHSRFHGKMGWTVAAWARIVSWSAASAAEG